MDLFSLHSHIAQHQPGISLAQVRRAALQPVTQKYGEALDLVRRDRRFGGGESLAQGGDFIGQLIAPETQTDHPLAQTGIASIHEAFLDQLQQPGETRLGLAVGVSQFAQLVAMALIPLKRGLEVIFQQCRQAIGMKNAAGNLADDDVVEAAHRHAQADAGQAALLEAARAAVVAVLPALAGVLDQGSATVAAAGDAGEQGRAVDNARRDSPGLAALEQSLGGVERRFVDDRGNLHGDPFRGRAGTAVTAVGPVEVMPAVIGGAGQDHMDTAGRELVAPPDDAALVEVACDRLDPHRLAVEAGREIEDQADDAGLVGIDDQHLLVLGAATFGDRDAVSERRRRAVPETLPGILQHGAMDMLGVLAALVLVEDVEHLAQEFAATVLGDFLRDRDELDPGLAQFPDVELGVHRIAAEPAQRVNDHEIEGMVGPLGGVDHLLEHRPVLVERGGAGLLEDLDDLEPLLFAPRPALGDLVRKRQVVFGLPDGGNTGVDGGTGHGQAVPNRMALMSGARNERQMAISSRSGGNKSGSRVTLIASVAPRSVGRMSGRAIGALRNE